MLNAPGDWGLGSLGGSTAYFIAADWLLKEDVILFYVGQVTIQTSAIQASPADLCKQWEDWYHPQSILLPSEAHQNKVVCRQGGDD